MKDYLKDDATRWPTVNPTVVRQRLWNTKYRIDHRVVGEKPTKAETELCEFCNKHHGCCLMYSGYNDKEHVPLGCPAFNEPWMLPFLNL